MQTITPKPEVAKRRDSVPVFSFVDMNFFWCGALCECATNVRCLFACIQEREAPRCASWQRKSRYIARERVKLNSKYIVFLWHTSEQLSIGGGHTRSWGYIGRRSDSVMFRFEAEARSADFGTFQRTLHIVMPICEIRSPQANSLVLNNLYGP